MTSILLEALKQGGFATGMVVLFFVLQRLWLRYTKRDDRSDKVLQDLAERGQNALERGDDTARNMAVSAQKATEDLVRKQINTQNRMVEEFQHEISRLQEARLTEALRVISAMDGMDESNKLMTEALESLEKSRDEQISDFAEIFKALVILDQKLALLLATSVKQLPSTMENTNADEGRYRKP